MRITIRPAPHSKQCALGSQGCTKGRNNPAACQTCDTCCERKHCVMLADALAAMLRMQGHEVHIIGDEYALGHPAAKANAYAYAAMRKVADIAPGLHIAIHTNSAAASVRGVRIGYPKDDSARAARAYVLAELVADRNRAIYPIPSKVQTCTYDFLELNRPDCPAIYIEAAFANSNAEDARWVHGNVTAIAQSYADGVRDWIEMEDAKMCALYLAKVTCTYDAGIGLYTSSTKAAKLAQAPKGATVEVLSAPDVKGFCLCRYDGRQGYMDTRYLTRHADAHASSGAALDKAYALRDAVNALITALGGTA